MQMIYFGMGSTQLLITGVSLMVPAEPSGDPRLAPLLVAPAFLCAAVSLLVPNLAAFRAANPRARSMVRWALAEAATLFGFVSYFVSGSHLYQGACLILGLGAWAAAWPRGGAE
jgi:hypothetical protein